MNEKNTTIKVEGMTCNSCAAGLQKRLEKQGLEDVDVNFSLGEANFVNPKNVSKGDILKTISDAGYEGFYDDQEEKSGLGKIEKFFFISLTFTLPLFFHMFVPKDFFLNNFWVQLGLSTPVFFIGVIHFGRSAWSSLKSGVPNMDVLIFIGSTAAYIYSIVGFLLSTNHDEAHNYLFFETTASIITLVLLGNLIEKKSVNQTTTALRDLLKLQITTAKKLQIDGSIIEVSSKDLLVNDIVVVNTGDQIPSDGVIIEGEGFLDESMITGESIDVTKKSNDPVVGGTILNDGNLKVKISATGNKTVLSKIILLVKNAQNDKPNIQRLGDKISAIFVPAVLGISVLSFILNHFVFDVSITDSIMRSIAVMVISCPCAMGLATPTAVMAGIGRAAKSGILIKGGQTLEELSKVKKFLFDKTGTLTTGDFKLYNFKSLIDESKFKSIISSIETHSSHPIAKSIVRELNSETKEVNFPSEWKGYGVKGKIDGCEYYVGKAFGDYITSESFDIHVWEDKSWIGGFDVKDQVKEGSKQLVLDLKAQNIDSVIISGDKKVKVEATAKELNISDFHFEKLPQEKLELIDQYIANSSVAMIGDGINDAPALAKANVGISFSNATQIAIQQSQIILLNNDHLKHISETYLIGKHTMKTIKQNLFWALFYNVVAIPIAAFGFLVPMYAALAMAFSDVIVIGNSIRLKNKKLT